VNTNELKRTIEAAIESLFKHQPNIFDFTPETGQTEWNLAHHLANELHVFFRSLDHDLDVTKKDYGYRRPDIIFHKRGTHEANHLVVELKKDGSHQEIEAAIDKIHTYWFQEPLRYDFGAVVNLQSDQTFQVQVFENPNP
jgi:hypothetical protein